MRGLFYVFLVSLSAVLLYSCALDNLPPSDPVVISPKDGATLNSSIVALSWSSYDPDGDPIRVIVEFGKSPSDMREIYDFISEGTETSFEVAATCTDNGEYYWQIIQIDRNGLKTIGEIWSFSVNIR